MAYVVCTTSEGLRSSELTVEVRDIEDRPEFLRVHSDFVKKLDDLSYLPIGIVYHDRDDDRFLIELPHEADSGTNRLWVSKTSLYDPRQRQEPVLT